MAGLGNLDPAMEVRILLPEPLFLVKSMKITERDVIQVARLARLRLRPEEIEPMTGQLNAILDYFETLQQVDTTDIPPATHAVAMTNAVRDDICAPSLMPEAALRNAPETEQSFFKVPKIIET
jgi:aspartyl-tRNA(Asn)/glutamyl-tRNA(Gln) amidotransferase subunit C